MLQQIWLGYNLGTVALKPYKRATKPYQNDTVLTRKIMEFMIYIEPEKESEGSKVLIHKQVNHSFWNSNRERAILSNKEER